MLARYCLKYGIDGVIVSAQGNQEDSELQEKLVDVIKAIRLEDKQNKLTVIAAGCQYQGVQTGAEAVKYLKAGATNVQILSRMFVEGPYAPRNLEREIFQQFSAGI